ncbi:FAD/NAD(P)-binding protein [Corynebacterium sp. TA-R-1]|uniref:FAD/NAD(P)-binding protein n=1 Tax=Corynebacterium stercoris TaxID=2943490 RepID=A0ABT1G3I9_9CORY|nr:FAD/NAD(P)-binding protein [Corynebacterium stercoris]MCP1388581.1 FAD/NAD(P)-binding protein [Corynebacterium stercoris]
MKVAIVGAGPRGLWAAESLMERARQRGAAIELTVFNDRPLAEASALGAFQPGLPGQWLLNAPKSIVETQLRALDPDHELASDFPSRGTVGDLLAESWRELDAHLPPACSLTHRELAVTDIAPKGDGVEVHGERFDEVLITTGHADTWPGSLAGTEIADVPVIAPAYPASQLDSVRDDDIALVRGAALTFIDVVRRAKARVFYPVTRSGRFMEVKGYLDDAAAAQAAPAIEEASAAILTCEELAELKAILAECAMRVLEAAGGEGSAADVRAVLDGADFTGDPVAELRASLAAAEGEAPLTPALAVGIAFRDTYDALVDRASFGGRETLGGGDFDAFTRTMERVAFGPPSESAREVLALIDAGRIRIELIARGDEALADLAAEVGATVVIDSVLAPPGVVEGTLVGRLVESGIGETYADTRALHIERDGTLAGQAHIAAAGRMNEGLILGHDTLRRSEHDVVERWADRVSRAALSYPERVHGMPPLAPKHVAWSDELLANPDACRALIEEYGSPVNVLNPAPMAANIAELVDAGEAAGVETKVFYARKANKALVFADTARDTGNGVDVASENELRQVLARGVPGERIILSAAIKPDALLKLAIDNGVVISADNRGEYDRIAGLAQASARVALVAPRLAPDPATMPPTRFGERLDAWAQHLARPGEHVRAVGVHAHLHGYAAADRSSALTECMQLTDLLTAAGHAPEFIDIGGGVPMRYLADEGEWRAYQHAIEQQRNGYATPFTWKSDPLTNTYPYWQEPTRGPWLGEVLAGGIGAGLRERGLRLHLEPGRSLLDGCGVILAEVAFVKTRSDGLPLVGLAMNRTQCRTTSDDYLTDPYLVEASGAERPGELEAFLVGAYCIEDELILRRKIRFPRGVVPGDIVAIPNAAGYFMHILESASHQIPLAKNVVWEPGGQPRLDDIDA